MKCTVADFIVKYIDNQYVELDGIETKFVEGIFTIFGHGNVLGLGQSLEYENHNLNVIQGKNEQGMAHAAIGFTKEKKRKSIYAVTTSIGPGCTNLVTAAATATVNRLPLLLFPGDTFESRKPDPVLQQLEQTNSQGITASETLRPVSKYYDRVTNENQIFNILNNAFSILTDPELTGTVTISLPQDIQAKLIDVDKSMLKKKVWKIKRRIPSKEELDFIENRIKKHEKIVFICGGGVKYSEANDQLLKLSKLLNIPVVETQAGKSALVDSNLVLGGCGVTGTKVANDTINEATLIIAFGTRLNDFTSQSASLFIGKELININLGILDRNKQGGIAINADIKLVTEYLCNILKDEKIIKDDYYTNKSYEWDDELKNLLDKDSDKSSAMNQAKVILTLNKILEQDGIIVGASGSLPADLERLWKCYTKNNYHMEYGYSCMGYEINGALGAKLANPSRPVYVFVGDGSFNMLHSEILTSLQINMPINILLFDNSGFGCINNLQMEYGSKGYRTEYKYLLDNKEYDDLKVDYISIAKGYGANAIKINNYNDLYNIKNQSKTTLFNIPVLPKTMTTGYNSWWDVGFDRVDKTKYQEEKLSQLKTERRKRDGIVND